MPNDSKNTLLFIVAAMAMFIVYQIFVLEPAAKQRQLAAQAQAEASAEAQLPAGPSAPKVALTLPLDQALAASPRVKIDTPSLQGSIALKGGRIDDLELKGYRQTISPHSPLVELFRPEGSSDAYFTTFGWTGANLPGLPGDDTVWTLASGSTLASGHPIVLTYAAPMGLDFIRTIAVDDKFMFTVTDKVTNAGDTPVSLAPYASVQRQGLPEDIHTAVNVHQGSIGWLGDQLRLSSYKSWKKKGEIDQTSQGGWLGMTDKYWLAALIPAQGETVKAAFRVTPAQDVDIYDSSFLGAYRNLAPGTAAEATTRLFAGAKTAPLLREYAKTLGVPEFDRAIDWGRLWFLTRPIFASLEFFNRLVSNFGVSILLLTVCVKVLFFWPANKSYESMTRMKKVQPDLEKIRAKYKEEPQKLQQEMMQLYQREKINPFLGCLPMLATIPVFLALYKVLSVTIEMRHAPFFGWVQDLSARDPSTLWNLFGLIPWNPAAAPLIGGFFDGPLHLGVWALAYGVTMWLTQAMTPTTGMDPMQAKIMQFFPLVFTFVLSQFAVGLLIYYSWSNCLGIVQQYVIMRRFKVDNPIDQIIRAVTSRLKPKPSG